MSWAFLNLKDIKNLEKKYFFKMQTREEEIYSRSTNEIFSFQIKTCEILETIQFELEKELPLEVANFFEYNLKNISKTIKISSENILKYSDSFYLISETTSAARMVFESITTLLFILKSENFKAYFDYCRKTKELDEQTLENVKSFLGHHQLSPGNNKHKIIIKKLETDISRISAYLEHLKEKLNINTYKTFPKVKARCKQLGAFWELEYLSTYSVISNHLHGNVKSMHHEILKSKNPENSLKEKYNVNQHWTWISSTLGQFLEEICEYFPMHQHVDKYIILKKAHIKSIDKLYSGSSLNLVRA